MGSDPGDWSWDDRPKKKKERHYCRIEVTWTPEGKAQSVSRAFIDGDTNTWCDDEHILDEDAAKLAWFLDDHKSFAEECTPSNVTAKDVENVYEIVCAMIDALNGHRNVLAKLDVIRTHLDSDGIHRGKGTRDRRRAQFVDELKTHAIEIQAAPDEQKDKLVSDLIRRVSAYSKAFFTLDAVMVKDAVMSIDPHSKGGRKKGGDGKKGPPALGAQLIVMANAHEDFELYRRRPNQTDDNHLAYVVNKLQQGNRPGRGKPKSSAKKPKASAKEP